MWHNHRTILKNKILSLKILEDKIAYGDYCKLSQYWEIPAKDSIPDCSSFDTVVEYLNKYNNIYGSKTELVKIQKYLDNICLLVGARDETNRAKIINELNSNSAEKQRIENVLGHALTRIVPDHLNHYMSLITKLQTYKQCTKTNLIVNIIKRDNINIETKIPCVMAPPFALSCLCKYIRLEHLTDKSLKKGCQSVTDLKGSILGFYKLSCMRS